MITGESDSPEDAMPSQTSASVGVRNETINLLTERLSMYRTAVQLAKSANEVSKEKRFARGVKTLEQLLNSANSGVAIESDEIPPVLPPSAITAQAPKPPPKEEKVPAPVEPDPPLINFGDDVDMKESEGAVGGVDEEKLNILKNRQKEYKMAALAWKKFGNSEEAVQLLKVAKQFDIVIDSVSRGEFVDLSDMPPAPTLPSTQVDTPPKGEKRENEIQQNATTEPDIQGNYFQNHILYVVNIFLVGDVLKIISWIK